MPVRRFEQRARPNAKRGKLGGQLMRLGQNLLTASKRRQRPLVELGDFLLQAALAISLGALDGTDAQGAFIGHMTRPRLGLRLELGGGGRGQAVKFHLMRS